MFPDYNRSSDSYRECSEWALPDQLVFATVSALLRIASSHSRFRSDAISAIVRFTDQIVQQLKAGARECYLCV